MDFTNITLWICLIPPILILLLSNKLFAKNNKIRGGIHKGLILSLSLTLLGLINWVTLIIFVIVMLMAYSICHFGLHKSLRARKYLLAGTIPLLLAPLLYYKYAYFLGNNILNQQWDTLRALIIPVGISFYSFQLLGFCVDTLIRQLPMPKLIDYLNFSAFFPQIVAGPIERRESLLPQMENLDIQLTSKNCNIGIRYIILGIFFKMVLAENVALGIAPHYHGDSALYVWFSNILFCFRVYFDFAGYGLCAYGLAKCMGIQITLNFYSPYTAANVSIFWRRWHVSLTSWFTTYIYIPLGGSRTRFWILTTVFVFTVSGFWHGASWNFVIWGALAGITICIQRAFGMSGMTLWKPISYLLTLVTISIIMMFFYVGDVANCYSNIRLMLNAAAYEPAKFLDHSLPHIAISAIAATFSVVTIFLEFLSLKLKNHPYSLLISTPCILIMVFFLVLFTPGIQSDFIYFAF